jgi:hypothetical protein
VGSRSKVSWLNIKYGAKKPRILQKKQNQSFLGLKVAHTVSVLEVAKLGPTAIFSAVQ